MIRDINSNFTFTGAIRSRTNSTTSAGSATVTPSSSNFNFDNNVSYNVNANIYNSSVESYSGSTSVGPVRFSCYEALLTNSNVNFTNNASLTQSDGSAIASWMAFNGSTGTITVSNTSDIAATTYIVTNMYTGIYGSITLSTNVSITFTEAVTNTTVNNGTNTESNDDDHCMNASSEKLCVVYVVVTIIGSLMAIIGVAILLYCVLKKKPNNDVIRIEQHNVEEPDCSRDEDDLASGNQMNTHNAEAEGIHKITSIQNNKA